MTRCEYCYATDRPTHGIQAAGINGWTLRQICDPCERKYAVLPKPDAKPTRRVPRPRRGYIERTASL